MSFRFITWQGSRWLYTHSIWLYFKTSYVPISRMYLFTCVYSYNIKHCYFVTQLYDILYMYIYVHLQYIHILSSYIFISHIMYIRSFSPGAMLTRWHAWFQVQRGESIIGSRRRNRKLHVDGKLIWVIRKGYESYIYIMGSWVFVSR